MKLPLSKRLQACAAFVSKNARVADIGCDHGYLSIYLLQQGIASSVIASDINEGPLHCAKENAKKYGVFQQIEFYLSAGAEKLPHDFDTLICAGMGADTIISILDAAPWLKEKGYTLILQCQSKAPTLRQYLFENGWQLEAESVLKDGRFLYTVMKAHWQPNTSPIALGESYFPSVLLENGNIETQQYYHQVVKKLRISVEGHKEHPCAAQLQALAYLESLKTNFPPERN